jgi:hypothetical protein
MGSEIHLRVEPELMAALQAKKPKILAMNQFCHLLLEQALDKGITLIAPSESREPESISSEGAISTNVLSTKESTFRESTNTVQKRKQVQVSDEFNAFWKLYQSCPLKANTQRKNKAWEEWVKATKIETPERLVEALENAIAAIRRGQNVDGWAAPLPDCFRWLRDGCYTAALEDNPAQDNFAANGITFLS